MNKTNVPSSTALRRLLTPVAAAALVFITWAGRAGADELKLNDGTVIQGRIVEETENEIMMKLGSKMFLRVERSKIATVTRTSKVDNPLSPAARRKALLLRSASTTTASVAISSGTAPASPAAAATAKPATPAGARPAASTPPASTPPPPAATPAPGGHRNPVDDVRVETMKKDNVTVLYAIVIKTADVKGKMKEQLEDPVTDEAGLRKTAAKQEISLELSSIWTGVAKKDGGDTSWKSVVVTATATLRLPRWDPQAKPLPGPVAEWQAALEVLEKEAQARLGVVRDAIEPLKDGLSFAKAPTEEALREETSRLVKNALQSAEKRLQGRDRRREGRKPAVNEK